MVRGFEPSRPVNESHWGVADILSQSVPAYVESFLEAAHKTKYGFTLSDAVNMILMLHQLITDSESAILQKVYRNLGMSVHGALNHVQFKQVLDDYLVEWIV